MINLKEMIKKHERYAAFPYLCTAGRTTIGYGRNLQDNGISILEADFMLDNDIEECQRCLLKYSWYNIQPYDTKCALVDMCFNLGIPRLLLFKRMISALEKKDYKTAAAEALDSKWAKQVPNRAEYIASIFKKNGAGSNESRIRNN